MSEKKSFYVTTTLPYVNASPHIGFALELIQADIVARYQKLQGDDVFFNTGTDEHGAKVYEAAKKEEKEVQQYVDELAQKFKNLASALHLDTEILHFVRTTDPHHIRAAQEFWKQCKENVGPDGSDIYLQNYKIKYCVGCELEKTDSELVHEHCPIHPTLEIQIIEEENYFFRASRYRGELIDFYKKKWNFILSAASTAEAHSIALDLKDFSISRLKRKMPWGIDVPGDDQHVMYVWFDALINYISTIGWPDNETNFKKWWPAVQFAGKDQVRQQAVMWQAMLLSAGLPLSRNVVIHGFINSGGQKMSKSIGNVIDPLTIIEAYGTYGADALRYYLARHISPTEDSDFTMEKFKDAYNGNLANGLGNLVSRILKMAVEYDAFTEPTSQPYFGPYTNVFESFLGTYNIKKPIDDIWFDIGIVDKLIQDKKPFVLFKTQPEEARTIVRDLVLRLFHIARALEPFMPVVSLAIQHAIHEKKVLPPLFPRKE